MADKRTETWIKITEPDGSNLIASPEYIKKLLGVTVIEERVDHLAKIMAIATQVQYLCERIDEIQNELVREFFLPKMQVHIVESLKTKDLTQNEVAKQLPDFTKNPLTYHAFYEAWQAFEKAGVIVPISRGRGHARLWHLRVE